MKPISIEFKCFGPYLERQFIDFTQLEKNGVFLICGETGAGKTTILDAMSVALYGKSSGGTRGEISDMRCKLAGKDDETRVEFVFDEAGKRYKFLRTLSIKRVNESIEQQCMEQIGGEWRPLFANATKSKVNEKAEEIIGLSYDQFRQVIILPQGKFETLLTSKSDEKEEILSKLFDGERWKKATEIIQKKVKEDENELKAKKAAYDEKLKDNGCADLDELEQKIAGMEESLQELTGLEEEAKKKHEEQATLKENASRLKEKFDELDRLGEELAAMKEQEADIEKTEKAIGLAEKAEKLKPVYEEYKRAEENLDKAKTESEDAKIKLEAAEKAEKAAKAAKDKHDEGRRAYEEKKAHIVRLEAAKPLYLSLAEKQQRFNAAKRALDARASAVSDAEERFKKTDNACTLAIVEKEKASGAYREGMNAYLKGIGGKLAKELVSGEPCPVCGSCDHPSPAPTSESAVTDSELDRLSKAENDANDREVKTRGERSEAEKAKKQAEDARASAEAEYVTAKAEYESAEGMKQPGIDTLDALEKEIKAAKDAVAAFEQADKETAEKLQEAQNVLHTAQADADRLQNELEAKEQTEKEKASLWLAELDASVFADEAEFLQNRRDADEIRGLRDKCTEFRTQLKLKNEDFANKQAELKDAQKPDMDAIEKAVSDAKNEKDKLLSDRMTVNIKLENTRRDREELTEQKREIDSKAKTVDSNSLFAKHIGGTGISLQRYVLGARFSEVTAQANNLLKTIYNGRYRLYRTDEAAGGAHNKGLELEVYDRDQNQRRSVNTLSGGEKFLVALSLAIGLSAVVRAGGGVHMEAMFVDEGFGSLDDNAVDDAVSVLQEVRGDSNVVVGVISHVARLAETIPSKLEIEKGKNGSKILLRS